MTAGYTIEGARAWKQNTATGTKTYFLYDGVTPVVELDASGAVSATNTVGANGLVSRNVAGGGSVFYTFDERGTTAQRLDGSGTVLSSHMADAFGTMGSTLTGTSIDPYDGYGAQFGYYTDHETGFVLCTFRYYDPSTGKWLNRDPLGYEGGVNLYGYVTNNPVNSIDPTGLDGFSEGSFRSGLMGIDYLDNQASKYLKGAKPIHYKPLPYEVARGGPDYVAFNMSFGGWKGWTGQFVIDRYGASYFAPGLGYVGLSPKVASFSLVLGEIIQPFTPSRKQCSDFIRGRSLNVSAGYLAGLGFTAAPTPEGWKVAREGGLFTPQIGASYQYDLSTTKKDMSVRGAFSALWDAISVWKNW